MTAPPGATDRDFLDALESCILAPEVFDHAAHVRAAYLYARHLDFPDALARMRGALLAFTRALGKAERYHETVTTAFMALIAQRLHERGDPGGWEAFARMNPDLFDRGVLRRIYPPGVLESDLARRVFVLPGASAEPGPTAATAHN
jgi:hypothetical protein